MPDVLANKIIVSNAFTDAIDTPDALAAYVGNAAADQGRAFLAGITADEAAITDASAVAASVRDLITGVVGETFTLTTGVDSFVGTAGNDTFNATMGGVLDANAATLNSFDSIDGGAGTDTLNLVALNGVHVAVPTGASVKNIEIINILNKGNSTVDASGFIGAREVWQSETSAAISGLANGVVAGFNGVRARHASYDDDATSAAIQLDNAKAGSTVRISGDGLTDASIAGSVDGGNLAINLTTNTADAELTTLTLSLDKAG